FNESCVERASHVIDLSACESHRSNLQQCRVATDHSDGLKIAEAVGTQVILHSKERDGSLRSLASELGIPLILYEAGEALRFDYAAIKAGVIGVQNVMKSLKMLKGRRSRKKVKPVVAHRSAWIRNEYDGLVVPKVELGQTINKGQVIAQTVNPHGDELHAIKSPYHGIVIGISNIPVANEGEALFNVAQFDGERIEHASENVDVFAEAYDQKPI